MNWQDEGAGKLPILGGVYRISCRATGKTYIGGTLSLRYRWSDHRCLLNNLKHYNRELQRDWLIFGEQAFEFVIIEIIQRDSRPATRKQSAARRKIEKQTIMRQEQYWMCQYPESMLYNHYLPALDFSERVRGQGRRTDKE